MILFLLAAAAATPAQAGPPDPAEARLHHCIERVRADAVAGLAEANRWRDGRGGQLAEQCAGLAEATQAHWSAAAARFEAAAHAAAAVRDARAGGYWAQAGNAWLAAGEPVKARVALDAALSSGTLAGLQAGEAQLDDARALVATGDLRSGRVALDKALVPAAADPLAWLLSATLARRQDDLPRARHDIAEALSRSPDDASVQLEAGNIAAAGGDAAGARKAWAAAARLSPMSPQGQAAVAALRQFDPPGNAAGRGTSVGR